MSDEDDLKRARAAALDPKTVEAARVAAEAVLDLRDLPAVEATRAALDQGARAAGEPSAAALDQLKDVGADLKAGSLRALGEIGKLLEESQRDWIRRESDVEEDFRGLYKSIDQEATQPHITNSLLQKLIEVQQRQQQIFSEKLGAIIAAEQAVEQAVAHSTTPMWKTNLMLWVGALTLGAAIVGILVSIYIYLA